MKRVLFFTLLTLLFLTSKAPMGTASPGSAYYQMALRELNFVQAASLVPESIEETPWPTSVITREELVRFGWHNLREALEFLPSFYLIQDVNERVVAHRGVFRTNTSHLLFMEDGIRLDIPDFNAFLADYDYPLTDVSRIEVVRGAGSSLYGTSAFTGLVNIRRGKPEKHGTFFGEVGEFQQEIVDLSIKEKKIYLLGHYWNRRGEKVPLSVAEDYSTYPTAGEQYICPAPDNYAWLAKFGSEKNYLSWWHFRHEYQTPRGQKGQILLPEDRSSFGSMERAYLDVVAFKGSFERWGFEWEFLPSFTHFDDDSPQVRLTNREVGGPDFLNIEIETYRYSLRLHARKPLSWPGDYFLFGSTFEVQDIRKYLLQRLTPQAEFKNELPSRTEYNSAFFAQYKKHVRPDLLLNFGARYDYYESFGGHLSPRLALIWTCCDHVRTGLAYGEAFKAPPYFYRTSNPVLGYGASQGLSEEILKNFSLWTGYYWNNKTFLRAVTYYQRISDFVAYNSTLKEYANTGKLGLVGIELEGQYFSESLIFFANYSVYDLVETDDVPCALGGHLCSIPKWMIKGGVSYRVPVASARLFLSPTLRLYGRTLHISGEEFSPYMLVDFNILAKFRSGWEVELKVENVFDTHYERSGTVPPYPWPGRTSYLGVKLNF